MNVTLERSLGPIHVVMSPENTVMDLVRTAVEVYVKEGRRPLLQCADPKGFELHYSQYSLESTHSFASTLLTRIVLHCMEYYAVFFFFFFFLWSTVLLAFE
ncbi:hypothetical protein MA16_Dca025554 [Dendrobium catenatum]|uniref:DUF7054 domain-containing protein n=2 Tax=Dendrobium catenatum TaxID=906689 RepID=A0A2I0WRI8_9ASPA|nr:hypothetical protein MA16_Dca025554 [Dendrobium catenatum]